MVQINVGWQCVLKFFNYRGDMLRWFRNILPGFWAATTNTQFMTI